MDAGGLPERPLPGPPGDRTAAGPGDGQQGPFQVADLGLDSAALDALRNGLDRVDNHFWEEESFRRYMESREEALPAGTQRPWWKFWGTG